MPEMWYIEISTCIVGLPGPASFCTYSVEWKNIFSVQLSHISNKFIVKVIFLVRHQSYEICLDRVIVVSEENRERKDHRDIQYVLTRK